MGWSRSSATHSGSALGFFQPPGGLRKRTFHGLVSCRYQILDCLPSSFPLVGIAHLFPGRFASLRFLPRVPNAVSLTLSPPVSPNLHAPQYCYDEYCYPLLSGACQPSSPADYGLPFHLPKQTSRLSWVFETVIALSAGSAPFEALIPLRVRSRDLGLPRPHGRCSLCCPLQRTPPTPRNLEPASTLPIGGEPRHALPTRRPERAAQGTCNP
jgi:hypothetical protein